MVYFTYNLIVVGKYNSPMDPMGTVNQESECFFCAQSTKAIASGKTTFQECAGKEIAGPLGRVVMFQRLPLLRLANIPYMERLGIDVCC